MPEAQVRQGRAPAGIETLAERWSGSTGLTQPMPTPSAVTANQSWMTAATTLYSVEAGTLAVPRVGPGGGAGLTTLRRVPSCQG